jgi:hypothetical protein
MLRNIQPAKQRHSDYLPSRSLIHPNIRINLKPSTEGGEEDMEPLHDWRSPQFEERLGRLDRGGVAFEFLRRNPQYRQDYVETLTRIASGGMDKTAEIERLSRRWGLSFPGGPYCFCLVHPPDLAGHPLPCNAHCQGCSRRFRRPAAS